MGDIITNVAKYKKGWIGGGKETPCGYGSTMAATTKQRKWIPQMIKQYRIKTIADIGAGDLNWMNHVSLPKKVTYTAYDLFPRRSSVVEFNILDEIPEKVDLIMCLWVLNHFPYDDCLQALKNIKASGSKYLLMTDRPKWHKEQPKEIRMEALQSICVRETTGDLIKLIKL